MDLNGTIAPSGGGLSTRSSSVSVNPKSSIDGTASVRSGNGSGVNGGSTSIRGTFVSSSACGCILCERRDVVWVLVIFVATLIPTYV